MNETNKAIELQTLPAQKIPDIRYDEAGKLALGKPDAAIAHSRLRKLKFSESIRLRSAYYWLNYYQPEPNASNLERLRGYLRAFELFCELSAWQQAAQLLLIRLEISPNKPLHEQLGFWGYYREQLELYHPLLGKLDSQFDLICLQGLGNAYRILGQADRAIDYHQQQLELARSVGDKASEASALGGLGGCLLARGESQVTIEYHQQQLEIAREYKLFKEEVSALASIGHVLTFEEKWHDVISFFEQALQLSLQLDDLELELSVVRLLSNAYCLSGQPQNAIDVLKPKLNLTQNYENLYSYCYNLTNLTTAYMMLGCFEDAEQYGIESLRIADSMNYMQLKIITLNRLGVFYCYYSKKYQLAIDYFQQLLQQISYYNEFNFKDSLTFASLSYCYARLGDCELAMDYAKKAVAVARKSNDHRTKGLSLAVLAHACWHRGQYARALLILARAITILPSWKSVNSRIVFQKARETIFGFLKRS